MNGLMLGGLAGVPADKASLDELSSLVVVADGAERLKSFFSCLSGKTPSSFTYQGRALLENPDWYHERYYFDFSLPLASTLDALEIREIIGLRYGVGFDAEKFSTLVGRFGIRQETTLSLGYEFTARGQALLNYAFVLSLEEKPVALVLHPLIGLSSDDITLISSSTKTSPHGMLVLGFSVARLVPFSSAREYLFLNAEGACRLNAEDELTVLPSTNESRLTAPPLFRIGPSSVYALLPKSEVKDLDARFVKIKDLGKATP